MTTLTDRERIARIIEPEQWKRKDEILARGVSMTSRLIKNSERAADRLIAAGLQFKD